MKAANDAGDPVNRRRVAISLVVELDLDAWAAEYNIARPDVRDDVRSDVAGAVRHHLRDVLGFADATVKVRNASYRPARMRS